MALPQLALFAILFVPLRIWVPQLPVHLFFTFLSYGAVFGKTWPTIEHGIISRLPPHIQTRKLISKFSPPQTSIPVSYDPILRKYSRETAKRPPAIVGVRTGSVFAFRRFFSMSGIPCHWKVSLQSKPPICGSIDNGLCLKKFDHQGNFQIW